MEAGGASPVWLHFRKLTPEEKQGDAFRTRAARNEPAVCLYCHEQVPRHDASTKYMWSHLTEPTAKGGHGLAKEVLENLRSSPKAPPQRTAIRPTAPDLTQDAFHRLALKAVLGANLPLSIFEQKDMKALLVAIAPTFTFPSAKVLKRLIRDYHAKVVSGEKAAEIAIALTGAQKMNCLAHAPQLAINDAFELLKEEMEVLHSVTTFTRSSIITAQKFEKVQLAIIEDVKAGRPPPEQPSPLFAYPTGLNRDFALKKNEWKGVPKKLIVIGETRWDHKKQAIQRAFHLRSALQRLLAEENPDLLLPFVRAMDILEFVATVLCIFEDFISGVQTASRARLGFYTVAMKRIFGMFPDLMRDLRNNSCPLKTLQFVERLRDRLNLHLGNNNPNFPTSYFNPISLNCVFLDPRFKSMSDFDAPHNGGPSLQDLTIARIRAEVQQLIAQEAQNRNTEVVQAAQLQHTAQIEEAASDEEREDSMDIDSGSLLSMKKLGKRSEISDEVTLYINMTYVEPPNLGPHDDPVCLWWHQQKSHLPFLFLLAQKYHAVATSQASEERHNSAADLILTDHRMNIKAELLNQMLVLKLNPEVW